MHYYRQNNTKNIWYSKEPVEALPEFVSYLGKHPHPNPKMAVVAFVGNKETGFNIRELTNVSFLVVPPTLARRDKTDNITNE